MRKSSFSLKLLGGTLVVSAAAVSMALAADEKKKKDDGPGMTLSQKVGSLFGLIDQADYAPPPPPPPGAFNAPAGAGQFPNRSPAPAGNTAPSRMQNAPMNAGTNRPAMGGNMQPPQPKRSTDASDVSLGSSDETVANRPSMLAAPRPQPYMGAPTPTLQRPSIVTASKAPTMMNPATKTSPNVSAAPAVRPAPVGTVQSVQPLTTSSSRRRVPDSTPISTPLSTVNSGEASSADEPFAPSVPKFQDSPAAPSAAPAVASSNRPAALPLVDSAARTDEIPQPKKTNATSIPTATANLPSNVPAPAAPPVSPTPIASKIAAATKPSELPAGVLATHTSPELTLETLGPRNIVIGHEAAYRVVIRNRGNTAVDDVRILVSLPEHVEVVGLVGTTGSSSSAEEIARGGSLEWQLANIAPRSQEELTLTLVPRRSEPVELGVRWTTSTPMALAMVEVQEPKLALAINGPNEVTYGEQRLYKLTVSNPGSGTAENVVLHLMPLTPGDGEPVSHNIGDLKPGDTNVVEVELTARQAGELQIRTFTTAQGDLRADATSTVMVRRAALEVATVAPRLLFAGVPGAYEFRIRNTGDDIAHNVRVSIEMPAAAKLLSSIPAASGEDKSGQLTWTFDRMVPGSEQVCTLKCAWNHIGRQDLTIVAVADGDLRKATVAATEVQSVADLALDVVDTAGPIAVGQPVVYEIHVKNRGLKAAEGVDVVAYFSDGIEPERAEGQTYDLQPGMVAFKPLAVVGGGQEKILKITARAQSAGHHRLRVELISTSPQTRMSHEDATFFYADEAPATLTPQTAQPIRPTSNVAPMTMNPRSNGLR